MLRIFLSIVAAYVTAPSYPLHLCSISFPKGNIQVEHAETIEQQKKGLSGRNYISQGMLFSFQAPQKIHMWMQDTRQPLRIIMIKNHRVNEIFVAEKNSNKIHESMFLVDRMLELPVNQTYPALNDKLDIDCRPH